MENLVAVMLIWSILQIRFLAMEESEVETVKDNLYKTLGESARADPLAVPTVSL